MVYFRDTSRQFYPWRFFAESMLAEGQLPLWIPNAFSGAPFVANMQTAIFYPPNAAVFAIFPNALAFGYSFFFHIFLAGLFMYLFLRYIKLDRFCAFLSSIIFMYSGFLIAHTYAGHYSIITSVCWLPLTLLLFEMALRKKSLFHGLLIGIPIGLQFLAGHAQISFYSLIVLGLYFLFRSFLFVKESKDYKRVSKLLLILALALGVGISLAAIQLIPSFELSQHVTRAGGASYEFATSYSFPPHNLITTIMPNFYGNPVEESYLNVWNYWELSLYVGILTLILISFAIYFKRKNKYVLFFTGLAILSLLLAMGRNTPLFWILWKFVPGFDMFRVPAKFLFLFTFSASILAGFGFSFLRGNLSVQEKEKLWKFIKILIGISILLVFIIVTIYIARDQIIHFVKNIILQSYQVSDPSILSIETLQKIDMVYVSILKDLLIFLALIIGSIIILTFRIKRINPLKLKNLKIKPEDIFKIAVILFILSNLWFYNNSFIITKNSQEIYSEPDYIVFLKDNSKGFRYYDVDENILDNFQIIYGINSINGYDPLMLANYVQVFTSIHNLSNNQHHPILNLLNVKYILTSTQLNNSGFKLVFDNNDTYIYENEQVLPRAFVICNVTVSSEAEILQTLKTDSFNPIGPLLTDKNIDTTTHNGTGFESVEITKYSPNEIILKTNLTQPGFLVLSEVFYPEWNVCVDGKQQEIYPAYHALRAISLDAGLHVVKFSYAPSSLMMGFYITLFAIIFIAIIIGIKLIIHFNVLHLIKRK